MTVAPDVAGMLEGGFPCLLSTRQSTTHSRYQAMPLSIHIPPITPLLYKLIDRLFAEQIAQRPVDSRGHTLLAAANVKVGALV
jgi:hypothetical protein